MPARIYTGTDFRLSSFVFFQGVDCSSSLQRSFLGSLYLYQTSFELPRPCLLPRPCQIGGANTLPSHGETTTCTTWESRVSRYRPEALLSDSSESVMRIGGIIIGQSTDSGESVMRIGGNTGQLSDSGESVMRIGGNTGQLTDSGESVMRILITNLSELVEVNSTDWWCLIACAT